MSEARIYVVDDDETVRVTIAKIVTNLGWDVQTYGSAEDFLAEVDPSARGCVLADIQMPGMDGLAMQEEISRRGIGLPVIIISGYADVERAVTAMSRGAVTVIEKPVRMDMLREAIEKALQREEAAAEQALQRQVFISRKVTLTRREEETLDLMVLSMSSKAMADAMGISARTIEKHRERVMRKMGVDTAAELILYTARAAPELLRHARPAEDPPAEAQM